MAGAALFSVTGCVQILGLRERAESTDAGAVTSASVSDAAEASEAGTPAEGQCGKLVHSSATCASCMDSSCCAEARACAGDPACLEASACLAGCNDVACQARCDAFYALPDTLIALRSCRVRQCASACGSTCGEFVSGLSSCQACQQAQCCAQGAACASNTSCAALNLCVSNCFGVAPSCPSDCQARYTQGTSDYAAWYSCTSQCSSMCQPGQTWACLDGPINWPKPKAVGNVLFSVTFVSFSSEQPFAGMTVKACNKLDFACATPLDHGTTDATGLVALNVPAGLSGFDGYLDMSGGKVGGTGAAVFPTIWYPVPFVVADGWRGRTQLVSTDEFAALTMATGTTLDPTRGNVAMNAADCLFSPAAGVSFAIDDADQRTVRYYLNGSLPQPAATATDQSGIGGFINVPATLPARLAVVKATSGAAGGKSMGSLTFIVRPGTFSTSSLFAPLP